MMATITVPKKGTVAAPDHLDAVHIPSNTRRAMWRVIEWLISVVALGASALVLAPYLQEDTGEFIAPRIPFIVFLLIQVALGIWYLWSFISILRTGRTPVMKWLGVRWVKYDTGKPAGWATLGKMFLQGLVSGVTLGLGMPVICLVSMGEDGRTWFDRTTGVLTIDTRAGRDTATTAPPPKPLPVVEAPKPWNATASAAASLPPIPEPMPLAIDDVNYGTPIAGGAPIAPPSYIDAVPWSVPPQAVAPSPAPPRDAVPAHQAPTTRMVVPSPVTVVLDDGRSFALAGTLLLGRDPAPSPTHPMARCLAIEDPDRSISKTHVALSPASGGILVEDLHSTNGTKIITSAGEQPLQPGSPVIATQGTTIRYGSRSVMVSG